MGAVFAWSEPDSQGARKPAERLRLCAAMCGSREPLCWGAKPEDVEFHDIKGAAVSLLRRLGFGESVFVPGNGTGFAADASAQVLAGETVLGNLGRIAGSSVTRYDISEPAYALDLTLNPSCLARTRVGSTSRVPRFPSVKRDYAFVVSTGVIAGALLATARRAVGELGEEVEVFDRFQGKSLGSDRQSIGVRLTLRAADRTLTAAEVDGVTQKLKTALKRELGAELRA